MKVTPLDIRRKEFKRSMRGYADEEVDLFLDDVADEFERLFQENIELTERIQGLEEQIASHAQVRGALEKTLVAAQVQADQMVAQARKEAELVLRDAELKARNLVSDSYAETRRVQQTLIQLKHLEEDFRFKFRSLLEAYLKLLEEAPLSASTPAVPNPPLSEPGDTEVPAGEAEAVTGEQAAESEVVEAAGGPADVPSPAMSAWAEDAPTEETEPQGDIDLGEDLLDDSLESASDYGLTVEEPTAELAEEALAFDDMHQKGARVAMAGDENGRGGENANETMAFSAGGLGQDKGAYASLATEPQGFFLGKRREAEETSPQTKTDEDLESTGKHMDRDFEW